MANVSTPQPKQGNKFAQFWQLTKPRVTQLAVFCAIIGMLLAQPSPPPLIKIVLTALGIGLFAGSAFAMNCLLERRVDAKMRRTAWRASAAGELTVNEILFGAAIFGGLGFGILFVFINPLSAWLTAATFIGYALIYTLWLKPATPQNIVIGGLSGAMPPAIGWAAAANALPAQAWVLVLLIFIWTPPHFWALALYREADYRASGLPMLPVTHGRELTLQHIFLYTLLLTASTLLPFALGMNGVVYLVIATLLNTEFMRRAWLLWRGYSDDAARSLFRFSIIYLSLLFAALLLDHYLGF